ncbi:MAG: hypothetical protein KC506_00980 [Nanoarchaeota archaeon]|nr:hypothetical protein [Nanoarchaeota archaeon]
MCGVICQTKSEEQDLNITYRRDETGDIIASSSVPEAKPYLEHLRYEQSINKIADYVNNFPPPKH